MSRILPKQLSRVLPVENICTEHEKKIEKTFYYYCSYRVFEPFSSFGYTGDCVIKEKSAYLTMEVQAQFKIDILLALKKQGVNVDSLVFLQIINLGEYKP